MSNLIRKYSSLIALLLFLILQAHVSAQGAESSVGEKLWTEAKQRYSEGEFDRAAQIYEELAIAEPRNIPVLKNLALCYARLGEDPRALLLLRQLKAYGAGGPAVTADIALLRQRLSLDGIEPIAAWEAIALRFGLNPRLWFASAQNAPFYAATLSLILGIFCVALGRKKDKKLLKLVGAVIGAVGIVVSAFIAYQVFSIRETSEATILFGTPAWSGPDKENFQPISRFDPGEIVTVLSPELDAGFARVSLGDNKTGFIPEAMLGTHEIVFFPNSPAFKPLFLDKKREGSTTKNKAISSDSDPAATSPED